MTYNALARDAHAIKASVTDGAQAVVNTGDATKVILFHAITGQTSGGYVTVEYSPDGTTWFTMPAGCGTVRSSNTNAAECILITPIPQFIRVTLHRTDGTHDVWVSVTEG